MRGLQILFILISVNFYLLNAPVCADPDSRVTRLFQTIETGGLTPFLTAVIMERTFSQLLRRPLTPEEINQIFEKLERDFSEDRREAFFNVLQQHSDSLPSQLLPEFKSLEKSETPFRDSRQIFTSMDGSRVRIELGLQILTRSEIFRRIKDGDKAWAESVILSDEASGLGLVLALKVYRRLELKPEMLPHLFKHMSTLIQKSNPSWEESMAAKELSYRLQKLIRGSYQDADSERSVVQATLSLPPSPERAVLIQTLRGAQRSSDRVPLIEAVLMALENKSPNMRPDEVTNLLEIVSYNARDLPKSQKPRLRRLLKLYPEWASSKEAEPLRMTASRLPLDIYVCWRAIKNSVHRRLKK